MNRIAPAVVLTVAATFLSGCWIADVLTNKGKRYPLPATALYGPEVCGQKSCEPGNDGIPFHFTRNPYSPPVRSTTTPDSVALYLIGHTSNNSYGRTPFTCSDDSDDSPFDASDFESLGFDDGIDVNYRRSETLDIDVNAAVESDIDAMRQAGLLQGATGVEDLRAKLSSAYSSLDESVVTVTARYFEYGIEPHEYRNVFQDEDYPECSAIIRGGERFITAVGFIWYDLEYESSSANSLVAEAQSELTSKGINFNFGASVRRTVNKDLDISTDNGFQVVAWRTADASHFRNR